MHVALQQIWQVLPFTPNHSYSTNIPLPCAFWQPQQLSVWQSKLAPDSVQADLSIKQSVTLHPCAEEKNNSGTCVKASSSRKTMPRNDSLECITLKASKKCEYK